MPDYKNKLLNTSKQIHSFLHKNKLCVNVVVSLIDKQINDVTIL